MYDFVDRRTDAERERDLRYAEQRRQNAILARGFLNQIRKMLDADEQIAVGLVGDSFLSSGAELLVESDGVTYKLTASVNHDD